MTRRLANDLRSRGSLKWTATPADVAAWVAESDLGTAPAVVEAVRGAVDRELLGYLPPAVRRELGEALAAWYGERWGLALEPDRVMPVGDVREAVRVAVEVFSRPGSPLVVPTPTYMPFLTAPATWGRSVIQVPMARDGGRWTPDLDGVAAAFRAGGHLLLLVNPQNPTGTVLTADELRAVADVVAEHDGLVLADEVHAPLVHRGHAHVPYASVSPTAAAHSLTATSASKGWNVPGLKCAQVVVTSDRMLERWRALDAHLTGGASTLGAVASAAAWRDGGPWLDGLVERLAENRAAFAEELTVAAGDLVRHDPAEGTYLAWVDLRPGLEHHPDAPAWREGPPGALARWLQRRAGLAVTDGAACGEAGRGFVRVTLATPRPLVVDAARRIASALRP